MSGFFLAETLDPSVVNAGTVTTGVLLAVIARLYTELRGENKQSREDKIAAIEAMGRATAALDKLSTVSNGQYAGIKREIVGIKRELVVARKELAELRKVTDAHNNQKVG